MKTLPFAFLLLCLFTVAACGDDDETITVCTQADWTGTYTGIIDCGEEGVDSTTVTIIAAGDNIIIAHEEGDDISTVTTTYDPLPFDGCDFSFSGTEQGVTVSAEAGLNGDELTLIESFTVGSEVSSCTILATRD